MQVQNPEVGVIARDQAGLTIAEGFPQSLSSQIIPVLDITPDFHVKKYIASAAVSATGSGGVLSAKPNVKYAIHGFVASFVKDATCDGADGTIQWTITQEGVTRAIVSFPVITLTAQTQSAVVKFDYPIICDENTGITTASYTFTAGKCRRNINLFVSEINK